MVDRSPSNWWVTLPIGENYFRRMRSDHPRSHSRKGFSFIEVILYIALVSFVSTAILSFTLEISEIAQRDRSAHAVLSDARGAVERMRFLIRGAEEVDVDASRFLDADGRLVLKKNGSSGTYTLSVRDGVLEVQDDGESMALTSDGSRVRSLIFENGTSPDGRSQSIGFELIMSGSTQTVDPPLSETSIRSGAEVRNVH